MTTSPQTYHRPLTTTEAAARLGVSQRSIIRWADSGRLPSWRTPGGQRRIDPADLDRLRASR